MTHKLSILDPTGHTEFSWDDSDGGGLAVAEQAFAAETAKRSVAFATSPTGTRKVKALSEVKVGEDVVIVPQYVGG